MPISDDETARARRRLLLGALAAPLAACNPSGRRAGAPVTLVFKHAKLFGDPAPLRALLDDFEQRNPGIRVRDETLPSSSDAQHQFYAINLQARSTAFDVFAADVIWVAGFARAGWLRDLSDLLPATRARRVLSRPDAGGDLSRPRLRAALVRRRGPALLPRDLLARHGHARAAHLGRAGGHRAGGHRARARPAGFRLAGQAVRGTGLQCARVPLEQPGRGLRGGARGARQRGQSRGTALHGRPGPSLPRLARVGHDSHRGTDAARVRPGARPLHAQLALRLDAVRGPGLARARRGRHHRAAALSGRRVRRDARRLAARSERGFARARSGGPAGRLARIAGGAETARARLRLPALARSPSTTTPTCSRNSRRSVCCARSSRAPDRAR